MKVKLMLLTLLLPTMLGAQIVYHDAAQFPLLGKATDATAGRYDRLPDSLETKARKQLVDLGHNSAGMAIRFRSNSTTIKAKWEVLNKFGMGHMTNIGVRGVDLYCMDEGKWYFAGSGFPGGKESEALLIKDMPARDREFMLYLPLYDGTVKVAIGVDSLATISGPQVNHPVQERPLVFYGTSILQGGCANRPGMAHTNILSRWLGRECINLGFSGNARLDYEVAEVIASVKDASVIVLDFLPNVTIEQLKERFFPFYKIIRQACPDTPILLVENPPFPNGRFNAEIQEHLTTENGIYKEYFKQLKKEGDKNVYYFSNEGMIGDDGEATVDGSHFTDLGFMRYAEKLYPVLKKLVKE
ncbi:MAG: SGNH/GDSL hydrolase family protein [Bacteroides sp.]|nr:SGNH/GDSL hydrolase family protein [Bacteroides sp.]